MYLPEIEQAGKNETALWLKGGANNQLSIFLRKLETILGCDRSLVFTAADSRGRIFRQP
jgi:hypothetical protein